MWSPARRIAAIVMTQLVSGLLASACLAQEEVADSCGPLRPPGQYGPFDYRKDADKIGVVTAHHFSPQVELLLRGQEGTLGGDLDYVLRAVPNHVRALLSMTRLGEKLKTDQPNGAKYSVECYYARAIRYAQDDQVVRMLYASYLIQHARPKEARLQLEAAESLAGDNPLTYYNLGLLYFDLKDYDKALSCAHTARGMGVMQTGLREKLEGVGRWVEPPPEAASAPASAASQ